MSLLNDHLAAIDSLRDLGRMCHSRGWSLGTSSNYSTRLSQVPLRILITASGKDKGRLERNDFTIVDQTGLSIDASLPKPSAETLLHVVLETLPGIGAVVHTHSVWATNLSDLFASEGQLVIEGYEMLKGLSGVTTHEHREVVPIYENTQDIATLAETLRRKLRAGGEPGHGLLLRRHGLYTWGADLEEARRHLEVFEFLFEVIGRRKSIGL